MTPAPTSATTRQPESRTDQQTLLAVPALSDSSELIANAEVLATFLARHRHTMLLTGAGISTASGIPDYRDRDGIRRGRLPVQGAEFRQSEAVRKRYWARSMIGWPTLAQARPNAAHLALAALQQHARAGALLTQNVDGLHQQAGSREVIELHGNIHRVICLQCATQFPRAEVQQTLQALNPELAGTLAQPLPDGDAQLEPDAHTDFHVPACPRCGGMLQPDVVFFGDGVPRARAEVAEQAVQQADALLVVGSSLMVFSGFRFARMAAEAGKPVIVLNRGVTRADSLLTLKMEFAAEHMLPQVLRQLGIAALTEAQVEAAEVEAGVQSAALSDPLSHPLSRT
ncbi:NAD-dependent protein deacetylase [Herbaspirillum lusitanum]|uniref:protein acetyllysine N-acetyltransferase n=1 Tax=Herbaspirillum lusitanum TaxID=213312 RepID=A0ABW9A4C6_9BURK